MPKWIKRWNTWTAPKPVLPGVWVRRDGGFLVRARTTDRQTGKRIEIKFVVVDTSDPVDALRQLQAAVRTRVSGGPHKLKSMPRFATFAVSLLEEKVKARRIRSRSGRDKWRSILECHLIPAFGAMFVDEIRYAHVADWRSRIADDIDDEEYAATTANTWLAILRVIMNAARKRFEIEHDAMQGIEDFDTTCDETYTEEEPNSLTVEELPVFIESAKELYPGHHAQVFLGFMTGLRPSTMRPLRRQGARADVLWADGLLLVRQSHNGGDEIMPCTKTGTRNKLPIPEVVIEVLRKHVDNLPLGPMRASDLLFPAADGGLQDRGSLRRVFKDVSAAMGLQKRITPRAMRRTFQDLARRAQVPDLVTRSISGHCTTQMQEHYSTVSLDERRQAIARMASLLRPVPPAELPKIG